MAINNLSGNIQPPTADNGTRLPESSSRAPLAKDVSNVKPLNLVNNDKLEPKASNDLSDEETVKSTIEEFQQFNQNINRSIQFKIDDELGVTIVRVIDKETEELIRQFPPEELLNLSKRLHDFNDESSTKSGVLLQEKV
jgi:flagellar protein FlaG